MAKQKVWFEKKPEFRDECPFFVYGEHLHYCSLKKVNIFDNKDKCTYCPLQSIKTHDRELVREVCEKIKEKIVYYPVSVLDEAGKVKANTWGISKKDIENLINQIQKEYEK